MNRRTLLGGLAALLPFPAAAHDWTGGGDPALAEWFMSLRREDNMSCCGLGDAYPCQILREADPDKPYEDTGLVQITDGRELNVLNNTVHRPALRRGLQIAFPFFKMTKEKNGNPTDTAWIFLSVYEANPPSAETNGVGQVYCVVPLPVGY